jgi:hypothetical protein
VQYLCGVKNNNIMDMANVNERKVGEMFTSSALKKYNPKVQFVFTSLISIAVMLVGRFILHSDDLVIYAGSFGVVFYALWNPWLALLTDDNRNYFIASVIGYTAISVLLFSLMYSWTGLSIINSMEMRLTLISATFYAVVSYLTMVAIKMLFLDQSEGGM